MKCFNPRTHTGCDGSTVAFCCFLAVSIHAPTRGATTNDMPLIDATKFQSTHPHGVRRICRYRYRSSWSVSIHAPTRGATGGSCAAYSSPPGFNPRTHTGCDYWPAIQRFYSFMVSIHAPTRGATMRNLSRRNTFSVSIHAPTRGATLSPFRIITLKLLFQSTHPHGVRPPWPQD